MKAIQFIQETATDAEIDGGQVVTAEYAEAIAKSLPELETSDMWTVSTNNGVPRYDGEPGHDSVSFKERNELIAFMKKYSFVPAYLDD